MHPLLKDFQNLPTLPVPSGHGLSASGAQPDPHRLQRVAGTANHIGSSWKHDTYVQVFITYQCVTAISDR